MLRSGNGAVDAKLRLEGPIWQRLPKKGMTQWWGRPMSLEVCAQKVHAKSYCYLEGGTDVRKLGNFNSRR